MEKEFKDEMDIKIQYNEKYIKVFIKDHTRVEDNERTYMLPINYDLVCSLLYPKIKSLNDL